MKKNLFGLNRPSSFVEGKATTYSRVDSLSIVSRWSDLAMFVARIAAVVAMLLLLGVGQMWGGSFTSDGSTYFYLNKTQYIKDSSTKIDYTKDGDVIWVYMWNATRDAWYKASNISGDIYGCQVTDADTFTKFIITRKGSSKDEGSWTGVDNQTNDYDFEDNKNYKTADGWDSYGTPSLVGSFNSWNAATNEFREGSTSLTLTAGTNYTFKVIEGSTYYGNSGTISSSQREWLFETDKGDCTITPSTTGTYFFNWDADNNRLTVIYPDLAAKKELTKNKYVYFNASSAATTGGGWNTATFKARFWFKYYDSGINNSAVDCPKASALETDVYYAQVPNHDYIGRIQLNRLNPSDDGVWCTADIAYAYERTNGDENCLTMEDGKLDYCNSWRPQWTYYCPPMSSATITHNSTNTITYGGNGGENTPYLVAAGSSIYVSAGSISALADNNMTPYYQFKKEGSNDGGESDSNTHTYTASNTNNTKEAMTVVARNKYSSTYGTASDASSAIYYEARTPYTISYNKGTNGTGTRGSEIKVDGVSFTLPNSAVFTRTGYTQTGWTKTDGGTQTHALGAGYTDNVAQEFFPVWTPKNYTVTLNNKEADEGDEGTESVDVTFDATTGLISAITKPSKEHYDFGGYYVSNDDGVTLTETQLIDANGYWIKNVSGYTGESDDYATWVYANNITLYAKWTEHEYAVTIAVTGSGSTSPANSTTAKYVTESGNITATPSAGWHFRDWAFTKTEDNDDIWCADPFESTNATIHIKAQHDGTLTAHFDPTNYVVRLEDKGADAGHKGTPNVSVTYSTTTNLTSAIDCPQKRYYDFDGYWISTDGGNTLTTQLINTDGTWKKNITGYTGESDENATWVCAGDTTLYAKWIEHAYTVTASVSPEGAGSVNTVTDAHLTIPSSTITATPVNAAWVFDHWVCGDSVGIASGSGTNAVTVTAAKNSTITAYFKKRYELVGSYWNNDVEGNGGMPGWGRDGTGDFTINDFDAVNTDNGVDLSYTCSLNANKSYKFKIHDKKDGDYGKASDGSYYTMEANVVTEFGDGDKDVWIHTGGASGLFTFRITKMREDNGKYYPTLSIERPQQVNFGTGYADIDDVTTVTVGTKGGTLAVDTAGTAITTGTYVTYGADVNHDPIAATGYTFAGFYTSNAYSDAEPFTSDDPWMHYNVTSGDNAYAKFTEKPTSIHFANDGHGHVEIGGVTRTDTIVGIDTHRTIDAVPNAGYKFSSWAKTAGTDYDLTSTSTASTTLSGNGVGATSGQTVTANFELRYSIKGTMNGENWGTDHKISNIGRNASAKDTGYVEINLPANTTYEFAIQDLAGDNKWLKNGIDKVHNMTYAGDHANWHFGRANQTHNCGITTAGRGTYKFIFNITDTTITVVYPLSYQVNYGASVGGSVTVVDDDSQTVPNGGYVRSGGSVTYTPAASSGYSFAGWYTDGTYGTWFTNDNPWPNNSVAATSNAYAKFKSTNFVIYRTGDKAEDPRAAYDDVESYAGGTISEVVEYRMKVRNRDQWYSLCLPFTLDSVGVWDDEAGVYYDLVPYYRTSVGAALQGGHYIIRTPSTATNLSIAKFDDWRDPTSPTDFLPTKNTPYIIQWHMDYFQDKYVSFFGKSGQTIPISMSAGVSPTSNDVVNVRVNDAMVNGSVAGAYMLESDYGADGAWMRLENTATSRTIPPFECYILANSVTTTKYKVLRRGMTITDTPTGWDDVANSENKAHIMVYTISGFLIAHYTDCSFAEAARRLNADQQEGIFILRSDNESVKLMVGGK